MGFPTLFLYNWCIFSTVPSLYYFYFVYFAFSFHCLYQFVNFLIVNKGVSYFSMIDNSEINKLFPKIVLYIPCVTPIDSPVSLFFLPTLPFKTSIFLYFPSHSSTASNRCSQNSYFFLLYASSFGS